MTQSSEQNHNNFNLIEQIENTRPQMRADFATDLEAQLFDAPDTLTEKTRKLSLMTLPKTMRYSLTAAVLLVLTITVFATGQLVLDVLYRDEGLSTANIRGLGVELNQSETIGNTTIELLWGYADRNRITVAIGITAPHFQEMINTRNYNLYVNNEQIERVFGGYSELSRTWTTRTATFYYSYDISNWETVPEQLDLTYTIRAYSNDGTIDTPLEFDLQIPVNTAGFNINPEQTITESGVTMTLESVSVAESGIITVTCFEPPTTPENQDWSWGMPAYLLIEGQAYFGGGSNLISPNCIQHLFTRPLSTVDTNITWILRVPDFYGNRTDASLNDPDIRQQAEALGAEYWDNGSIHLPNNIMQEIGMSQQVDGEWIFTFNLQSFTQD